MRQPAAAFALLLAASVASANSPPIVRVTNPLTFVLTQGSFSAQVQAVERAQDAASFYNYFSASSHTGFEAPQESKVFLYRDTTTGSLSLFFTHNIDRNPGDPSFGPGSVTLDIAGVPGGAFVAQSDDPFQGGRPELDLSLDPEGAWNYQDNTDGGVIDGLPSDQPWCITISPIRFSNVNSWVYHYASGTSIPLDQFQPVEICLVPSTDVNTLDTDEGNDVSLSGEFDDADAFDSHVAGWAFGDGASAPAIISPGPGVTHHSVEPVFHAYGDDSTYPALLTVTDSAGESGSDTVTVRVHNVAPTALAFGPVFTSVGNFTTLSASATDPGSDDLTFDWNHADGSPNDVHPHYNDGASPDPIPSAAGNFPFSADDDAVHVWCVAGTYTVIVTVTDDDGGTDIATMQVNVAPTPVGPECNEPPVCDAGAYAAQQCGVIALTAATAADPDNDPLTHAWLADCDADGVFGDWPGFSDPSALNPTFTPPDPCGSTCVLRLAVSDGLETCVSFTSVAEDDTTAPMMTAGSIASCYPTVAAAEAAAIAATTASDNCSTSVTRTAATVGTCSATITVTGSDDCLNAASVSYSTRIDDTPPVVLTPAPLVIECTSPGGVPSTDIRVVRWLSAAVASDLCGGATPPTNDVPAFLSSGCAPGAPTLVTFASQDSCGNVGTATSTIRVIDSTPPSVSAGTIASCYPTVAAAEAAAIAATMASDNCSATITKTAATTGTCTATITVTGRDDCLNAASVNYSTRIDDTPPVITPPAPLVIECTSPGGVPSSDPRVVAWLASVTATDSCGGATLPTNNIPTFLPSGCAPGAPTLVTFTSQDPCGNVGTATSTIRVIDSTPPTVSAPAPLLLECNSPGGVLASDPRVIAWLASASSSDICGSASTPTNDAPALFPSGCLPGLTTVVVFSSQDGCANIGRARSTLTVVDTTPPVIAPNSGGDLCLWPPSHDWACFDRSSFHPAIHDECETAPISWRFVGCASNQPEDGLGDGHTAPDCAISPDGTLLCVRSERQGMEEVGRIYAVRIEAVDGCGNTSQADVGAIRVPRDQREHPDCIATTPPRGPKKTLPF